MEKSRSSSGKYFSEMDSYKDVSRELALKVSDEVIPQFPASAKSNREIFGEK